MRYKCLNVNNKRTQQLFLKFPSKLYKKNQCPQDYNTEKQILTGKHVLSKDIEVFPFLMVDERDNVMCRCLLTYYVNDPVGYVGFFEARDCISAVEQMFFYVTRHAIDNGKIKLIGPVDSSIYINYRFKIDRFDITYTGEPYNKETYFAMWKKCGFVISDRYSSNQLRIVKENDIDPRMQRVYERYLQKGYEIISPNEDNFYICMKNVYELMIRSYSGFTGYKKINEEQFMSMFSNLQKIANYDMIKLAYDKNFDLKAFCVAVPNYKDLTRGQITLSKLLKIRKIKKNPKEYVILYVGADANSAGIGSAVVHEIRNELHRNGCTSIGALIKEGNLTGKMYEDLYVDQYHYVLMSKKLMCED